MVCRGHTPQLRRVDMQAGWHQPRGNVRRGFPVTSGGLRAQGAPRREVSIKGGRIGLEIQTVALIGLGALGTLYGHHLAAVLPTGRLRVIADRDRIARYQSEGVYSNGERCDFFYASPDEPLPPADLVLVAVKALQLEEALEAIRGQVGEHTVILSLLNGISSEGDIAARYGWAAVVHCVAYGMDAVKQGNRLTYQHMGKLCVGPRAGGPVPETVQRVTRFFDRTGLPYELDEHMERRMWGKFMMNVGVNQTLAVFGPDYGALQRAGEQRETMIAAMREVVALSQCEGVGLTEKDVEVWLQVLSTLNPAGKPSMRQDVEAGRRTEVGLFAGTVLKLAAQHGIAAPVNRMLFDRISQIEAGYAKP